MRSKLVRRECGIRQMKEEQNTREEKMLLEMRTMLQPLMTKCHCFPQLHLLLSPLLSLRYHHLHLHLHLL